MEPTTSLSAEQLLAHAAWIRRLAARLVREPASADDVAQQTLLTALQRPPRDDRNPRGWLAQVARRVALHLRRSEGRRQAHELAAPRPDATPAVDDALIRASLQRSVVDAVIRLPEPYRAAILLRYLDELPPRRVAKQLGVPVETVRTRLKRGLALLREQLAGELDVERPDGGRMQGLAALAFLVSPPRGMGGAPIGGAGGAAAAGVLGALAMTVKSKLVLTGVAAAVAVFAVARFASSGGDRAARRTDTSRTAAPAPVEAAAAAERDVSQLAAPTRAPEPGGSAATTTASAGTTEPVDRVVTGVVRDETGRPVADALVAVEPCGSGGRLGDFDGLCGCSQGLFLMPVLPPRPSVKRLSGGPHEVWCTRSDADGRFDLPSPASPSINVAAVHPERGLALRAGLALTKDASSTTVDLTLDPGLIVSGHVTDAQGVGIGGAMIMFMGPGGSLDTFRTNESGAYRSLPQAFRKLGLGAWADGYVGNTGVDVDASPTEHERVVDFRLERADLLLGRVVNSDGTPFLRYPLGAEIEVLGCRADPRSMAAPRSSAVFGASFASDGAWKLQLTGRQPEWVALFAGSHLLDAAPIVAGQPGPDLVVDVEALAALLPTGGLSVTARDAAHALPICEYEIDFEPQRSSLPSAAAGFGQTRNVRSADGNFTTREVLSATYWITVKAFGYSPRTIAATATDAEPPPTVVVDLVQATSTVRGRVVSEEGRDIGGAKVTLLDRDGQPAVPGFDGVTTTDADGAFELAAVPAGDLFVVARPPPLPRDSEAIRYAPRALALHVAAETPPVTIKLPTALLVRVTLATRDPSLIGPFSFRLLDEKGARLRDDTSPAGWCEGYATNNRFDFWVAPGRHVLEALSRTTKPARLEFVAAPAATFTVDLVASGR